MDNIFFIASKVLSVFISPTTWLLVLPLLAWLFTSLRFKRLARILWVIEISMVLLIGFFPVGQWLVKPLEMHRPSLPNSELAPDGIIVLGGAWLSDRSQYWQQWELNHAAERDITLVALSRQFPDAQLVFTGGSGRLLSQQNKEATYAEMLYEDLGVDIARVVFESESRNTFENGTFTQRLIQPEANEVWWLITSAYHMPRSLGVFCQLNWPMQAYPVDHIYEGSSFTPYWAFEYHLWELSVVVREWVGLIVYRVTGKTSALFPTENCQ